ncbi:MAG: hypothetical protein A2901_06670 [Elusimicrobia bacterium RIFCSPLOWO2_01_FULL_54_10]|nr:MAG: hypothetical protein A2901_06670 [Elusimicrobia bacterium RIFCSPLOWO2_01_FULL_54_10]
MKHARFVLAAALMVAVSGGCNLYAKSAPPSAIGKILSARMSKGMLEPGDKVTLVIQKGFRVSPGMRLAVFKINMDLANSGSEADDEGARVEELGIIEIIRLKGIRQADGRVVSVQGDMEPGNWIKFER